MPTEEEMKEQLKNMTPEQILELQKQQCIFCKMVSGEVQARKVYEDDLFVAVLDINPGSPGHMLVMSKEHYNIMPQMPEPTIMHLGMLSKQLSQAALRGLKAKGTTIFVANGVAAGQRASHFLLHILPRMEDDGVGMAIPEGSISEEDLEKVHNALKPAVERLLGKPVVKAPIKEEQPEVIGKEEKEEDEYEEEEGNEEKEKEETEEEDDGEEDKEEEEKETEEEEESDNEEEDEVDEDETDEDEKEEEQEEEKEEVSDLDKITDFLTGGGK